ncbi:MAG: phage portal protein [Acidimicrobiales bacterium]|nr:phage portal protein [Acidimicrobiales bacterium]
MDQSQGSPAWWLGKLAARISQQTADAARLERYYEGLQPLAIATQEYREEFSRMLAAVCDNWMPIIVDAVEERLHVEGFRIGGDPAGDTDAWQLWQANCLDADSEIAHSTALTCGRAAVMVWAGDDGQPEITIEHPAQVAVAYAPGSRRRKLAAVKQWVDEWTGEHHANVYLPDRIAKLRRPDASSGWAERADEIPNPLGLVPIVELQNRPKLAGGRWGVRSEIAEVLSTQDQINKLVCDLLVAAEFGAFRQRWATGIELPVDPDTGVELEAFKVALDRLWHTSAPDARFGEFGQTDLANYTAAIENRVQSLASRTRTPPHYLLGQSGAFPSGESLKATETGLIAKVHSRQRHYGEAWEEVIRLAFAVLGDERSSATAAETIWSDPESRTESEHVDSLVKKLALGVPHQQLWEDAGYTPPQIARFKAMLAEHALTQAVSFGLDAPERLAGE